MLLNQINGQGVISTLSVFITFLYNKFMPFMDELTTYHYQYEVTLDDLDFMNHVGHAHWLTILMRARVNLLKQAGLPIEAFFEDKIYLVVAEINIKYSYPAVYGDILDIAMTPQYPFSKGFVLHYSVKNQKGINCVTADITLFFVDQSGKSILVPEKFLTILPKSKPN